MRKQTENLDIALISGIRLGEGHIVLGKNRELLQRVRPLKRLIPERLERPRA